MSEARALYRSPLGPIEVVAGDRLRRIRLLEEAGEAEATARTGPAAPFLSALERYFDGGSPEVPFGRLDPADCTDFRRRVYRALMDVPRGDLVSYGELARVAGSPGGARAVGQALSRNPTPIVVPCHRVIAADGGIGGFSAGAAWKRRLLEFEGHRMRGGRVLSCSADEYTIPERTAHSD